MGDENEARHVLAEMQARLARSAYDALDIQAGAAGPAEVRSAFLELAKTYHPQKFARMSPEIQRLANEVFLSLRAAHDQLAKRVVPAVRQSGPLPQLNLNKTPAPELLRQSSSSNTIPRQGSGPAVARTATPVASVQPRGPQQPPPPTSALAPGTQRGPAPAPTSTQPIARPQSPAAGNRPPTPSTQMRKLTPVGGVPVPPSGPRPAVAPAAAKPAAEPELAGVYDLMQKGEWNAARTTLNALIALQPKPRYKALLAYSHGREAQLARRLDEARVDLQGALEIDPDLQVAKTALAELFTRRK